MEKNGCNRISFNGMCQKTETGDLFSSFFVIFCREMLSGEWGTKKVAGMLNIMLSIYC